MLRTSAIIGGGKKEDRSDNDFYPTPWEVTESLMQFLKLPPCKIWEPACGNGAMSEVLIKHSHTVTSSDLRMSGYGLGNMNFLYTTEYVGFDAVITNPPFNLAEEFIRKSLSIAPIVAMVLKSQYWHAKKRYDLFTKFPPAYILPMTWRPDFMNGGSPTMDCIWTVWIEGNTECKFQPLIKPSLQINLI